MMFGNRAALPTLTSGARTDIPAERLRRVTEGLKKLGPAEPDDRPVRKALESLSRAMAYLGELRTGLRAAADPPIAASSETDPGARAALAEEYGRHRNSVLDLVAARDDFPRLLQTDQPGLTVLLPRGADYRIGPVPLALHDGALDLVAAIDGFRDHDAIGDVMSGIDRAFAFVDHGLSRYRRDHAYLSLLLGRPASPGTGGCTARP